MEHFQITFMILTSTAGISRFGKKQDLLLVCTKTQPVEADVLGVPESSMWVQRLSH